MSNLKKLKFLLKLGQLLGLAPVKFYVQKFYVVILAFLLTAGAIISLVYQAPVYKELTDIKLVLNILSDVTLWLSNVNSLTLTLKRKKWNLLFKTLTHDEPRKSSLVQLILTQAIFLMFVSYNIYVCQTVSNFEYFQRKILLMIQLYYLYFDVIVISTFLQLFLEHYEVINRQTLDTADVKTLTTVVEKECYKMKVTIDAFNDIFGWSFLLFTLYSSLLLLDYVSCVVALIILILQCGRVRSEVVKILNVLKKIALRRQTTNGDLDELIVTLSTHYFPVFSACDYFTIETKTVLDVLGVTVTYLIVIIQFDDKIVQV
uniref:Gustatory receptor n=1 Tax=Tribolium castaneum TaxID=7070 RepID=A2AX74_TRICA|nr:gustatory receptor candidate 12 [Tribolium castaneum]